MGKTPVNTALGSVRGKIDDWVYRVLEGETVIARRPRRETPLVPTTSQLTVREMFRRAADYAKSVYADPIRKQEYLELALRKGVSKSRLFSFIVQDYTNPPVIAGVDVTEYLKQAGNIIRVYATDNGELTEVKVTLKDPAGAVLEEGGTERVDAFWQFEATTTIPAATRVTVVVTAIDKPGNKSVREEVVA